MSSFLFMKICREFINVAAHELRTPVQPLLGITELLQQSMDVKNKVEVTKEELEMLVRNAKRLERLSSDILEVTRIESHSLKVNRETFNLNEKIQHVIDDVKSFIKHGQKVELIFQPKVTAPLIVEADKNKIFEVVSNLLRNAIKFTEQGTIVISLEEKDDHAVVTVKDTGEGIDAEIFPKLFTKFATKSEQGTGLGLYLSKSIIEVHGGKIWAENNKDGRGATFTFTIPLKAKMLMADSPLS
jgi:signal transduction histidine kinase